MVIIKTSATEVSIQAVSPEFGVHFSCVLASQAGGCANDGSTTSTLTKAARISPHARATSPAPENFLNVMVLLLSERMGRGLERRGIGLAGADADGLVEAEDEDLAVADLAGFGRNGDRVDDLVDLVGRNRHFDLQLGEKAHGVFGAAVNFRMALLAPISLDFSDGHPVHADPGQGVADLVELEWLDDGHDNFHR